MGLWRTGWVCGLLQEAVKLLEGGRKTINSEKPGMKGESGEGKKEETTNDYSFSTKKPRCQEQH